MTSQRGPAVRVVPGGCLGGRNGEIRANRAARIAASKLTAEHDFWSKAADEELVRLVEPPSIQRKYNLFQEQAPVLGLESLEKGTPAVG